jgi:HSP20 family protein
MMDIAEAVEVKKAGTPEETTRAIFDELKRDLADWMTADRDMVWRPAIDLIKENNEFVARALMPGVDSRDIEVMIAPEMLLIKGEIHRGEYGHTQLSRSLRFPRPVNPDRVHAELKDGMLSVRAEIAGAGKVKIFRPRAA